MDCNVRVKWHTGAETFAFYSRQRYWCGMFDYSPVCMPVFSMGLTLQDLHTLALGTRYSMKFYVERSDEVGSVSMYHVSSIIRGHGLTLYRGHVIPRLHWDIFFAATFIVLFIAVFAVFAIRQYSKRKVHVANKETSDSATTDVAVELTQILQQTDLSNAPDVINNDNYTHTLPRQPPQDLADSHSYDDNDKSRLLPRD
ncbi:uncharacterized protein LOC127846262 [Dreissena polymorpha]|nr:uncharacterized protein LOC127846262 [Dreissena polymorpha]